MYNLHLRFMGTAHALGTHVATTTKKVEKQIIFANFLLHLEAKKKKIKKQIKTVLIDLFDRSKSSIVLVTASSL